MAHCDKVRLNFVIGSYVGRNFIECTKTIHIYKHEPLSSLRKKMDIDVRKKIGSMKEGSIRVANMMTRSVSSFIFDEMLVEDEATPMGLGMVDGDTLVMMQKDVVMKEAIDRTKRNRKELVGEAEIVMKKMIGKTKRKSKEISVCLNVLLGEAEGGLPLPGSPDPCPSPKCRELLTNLQTALLPALQMTVEEVVAGGMAPYHRPDFSKVKANMAEGHYVHAHQGLKEVEEILERYHEGIMIINNTFQNVPGSREDLGPGIVQEVIRREQLQKNIAGIMAKAVKVPVCQEEKNDIVYFMGPSRNCTLLNYLSCPPTVQLRRVGKKTTVDELVKAWISYVKSDAQSLHLDDVLYDNVRYGLTEDIKVEELVCPNLKKHYFCLNIDQGLRNHFFYINSLNLNKNQQKEDIRDIDQLLEFIEGNNRKEQDKNIKTKKKTKAEIKPSSLSKSKISYAEDEALKIGTEALETNGDTLQDIKSEKAEKTQILQDKLEKKKGLKENPHKCLPGNIVGGCKKKVKSKQRNAELELHIAEKQAMLETFKESSSLKETCWNCLISSDAGKLFQCADCRVAWYCGEVCQREDWEKHWQWCQEKNLRKKKHTKEKEEGNKSTVFSTGSLASSLD